MHIMSLLIMNKNLSTKIQYFTTYYNKTGFYQSQVWQVFHQECGSSSLDVDQHEKLQYQAAEIK